MVRERRERAVRAGRMRRRGKEMAIVWCLLGVMVEVWV